MPTARAGQNVRFIRLSFVALVVVAAMLSGRNVSAQPVASEYQVKAAYLLNFARFVDWPASALPASSPMQIVIVGDDSFGGALDEVLRGKTVNGHPIQLHHVHWDNVLTSYQIVFISASEEPHLAQIFHYLGNSSVLTVSDIDRFSLRGGAIEFRTVGNRVRFDINRTPATNAQLTISSKLLSVARAIHEGDAAP